MEKNKGEKISSSEFPAVSFGWIFLKVFRKGVFADFLSFSGAYGKIEIGARPYGSRCLTYESSGRLGREAAEPQL